MQSRYLGAILLGIWLILTGLLPLVETSLKIPWAGIVLAVLAIAAGVFLLLRPGSSAARWASFCCAPGSS